MKIVTEGECLAWLSKRLDEPFQWTSAERTYRESIAYLIPGDAGRKTALARALTGMLDPAGEGLLWITDWGVFPSSENVPLFIGYRRSLGEQRSVHAAPGHVFGEQDTEAVECLLDLILYFSWDASVFDANALWLRISHDEVISIFAKDRESLRAAEEVLSRHELKELSGTANA